MSFVTLLFALVAVACVVSAVAVLAARPQDSGRSDAVGRALTAILLILLAIITGGLAFINFAFRNYTF